MPAWRTGNGGIDGVVPSARGKFDDASADSIRHLDSGETRSSVVKDPHGIAVPQATSLGVCGVDTSHLVPFDLAIGAV